MRYEGRCHCGAIGYTYDTELAPAAWSLRECQCAFCRAHGARTTADPKGTVQFHAQGMERLRRYRFAHRITDFLLCADCGVYIGATTEVEGRLLATVNVNALRPSPEDLKSPTPASYDGESPEARSRRRQRAWTQCRGIVARA
jgi:hypothetical protein